MPLNPRSLDLNFEQDTNDMKLSTKNSSNILVAALLLIAGANAASSEDGFYFTCSVQARNGDQVLGESVYRLDNPVKMSDTVLSESVNTPTSELYFRVRRASQLVHRAGRPDPPTVEALIESCRAKAQEEFPDSEHVITGLFVKDTDSPSKNYNIDTIIAWDDKTEIRLNNPFNVNIVVNQMDYHTRMTENDA